MSQLKHAWADHQMHDDWATRMLDFMEANGGGGAPAADGFTFLQRRPTECVAQRRQCDNDWPPEEAGALYTYASRERFAGASHQRQFHAYLPNRLEGQAPLLIYLHGGFGDGLKLLAHALDELADGRPVSWRPNTEDCQFTFPSGYAHPDTGDRCRAPAVELPPAEPFVLVLPDGLPDAGEPTDGSPAARHWEDGRSPSPGHAAAGEAQVRDDVGFVHHIIETLLADATLTINPARIYLAGSSNGGMMTQRVACHIGDPAYPELARLAAVSVGVAALPTNLLDGAAGRPRCLNAGGPALPVQYVVGHGIDTPDCQAFPCDEPVADGDGRMPFGAPGEVHNVYSPELGAVASHADSRALWTAHNAATLGVEATLQEASVGAFTTEVVERFGDSPVRVRALITEGGAHEVGGVRMDIHPFAPHWDFVSGFRRAPDGEIHD